MNAQTKQYGAAVQENGLLAAAFAEARAGMFCQTRWLGVQAFFSSRRALLLTLGALAIGLLAQTARAGVTFTNLVSFAGTNGDSPIGTLVQGRDGDLYGVTQGGDTGGKIFKMALDGTLTTLASFNGTNGSWPHAGLVQGSDGNFYGTTSFGGQCSAQNGLGCGTVFQITPGGLLTTLVLFNGTNGQSPDADLVQGADGNFYGTTESGGQYHDSYGHGYGTVFKVTPSGVLTTLVSFNSTNDVGYSPWCSLAQGSDGNFYGMNRAPGTRGGCGTVFQMTPEGAVSTFLSFNCTNGAGSLFGLLRGADGNFYGTGELGGAYWCGTVYRLTTNGVLTTLASFNGTNGAYVRTMRQASDGNFYGMTQNGGIGYNGQYDSGYGTVFQVTSTGTITSLVLFTNGEMPFGGLMQASDGNLYGMTRQGGAYGRGAIFRLSVPMPPAFRTMTQTGSTVALTWSAVAGQTYQVQYSTTLGQTHWINLGIPFTATDGTATASDTMGPDPQRLYRVVLLP